MVDDTYVKELELRVKAAEEELAALEYAVSHDVRAPLRAIQGFAAAVEEDGADRLDEVSKKHLARVRAGAERMNALLEGLLSLSRLSRAPLQRTRVDLSKLARAIAKRLHASDSARTVTFAIEDGLEVEADEELTEKLLAALLDNAWKFTSKKPAATITLKRDGDRIVIEDDGAGFDAQYVARLFAPFQRLHGSDDFPGIGIGLATAKRIVRRHGGTIEVHGTKGEGARIAFTLG
jgi:signal transduction histidine kinase